MSQPADSHPSSDFCPNCYINLAERYCSECGQVFCLACSRQQVNEFYTCSTCGPENVEETEAGYICQECEKPARLATRRDYLCPNCGSTLVTPIHNMRQELVSHFRTTYYRLRKGHELLANFAAHLRILRWRIRELRLGGFLHDPDVEKELLDLITTELPSVHERVVFRARNVVERHQASKARFMTPEQWTTTDFPVLAGLIDGIRDDITDYQNYVQELIAKLDSKLTVIEERLTQMAGWHQLFADHLELLKLLDNERPVAAIQPVTLLKTESNEGIRNGILFITSMRLLFAGEKGLLNKETRMIHTLPLDAINEIREEGRIRRTLILTANDTVLKLRGSSKTLGEIPKILTFAQSFTQHSLVTTSGSMRVLNMKVDMTALRNELERLINHAIAPNDSSPERFPETPPSFTSPIEYYPPPYPQFNTRPDGLERDPLFKLQQQKYSIQSTMKLLKKQFEEGKVVDESFFKQYRSLTRELYLVETQIRKITGNPPPDEPLY